MRARGFAEPSLQYTEHLYNACSTVWTGAFGMNAHARGAGKARSCRSEHVRALALRSSQPVMIWAMYPRNFPCPP